MYNIAADVGGTNTRFAAATSKNPSIILYESRYSSTEFDAFYPMLVKFIDDAGVADSKISVLSLALPGIVDGGHASLTNLPWEIDMRQLEDDFNIDSVIFMNDFQASVIGTTMLSDDDSVVINQGMHKSGAVRVAVGAGTGLGLAWMCGDTDSARSFPTEGGHVDYAPAGPEQIKLLKYLADLYGHVSCERLLSGAGLVDIYRFCSGDEHSHIDAQWVNNAADSGNKDASNAMMLFVSIYGAYVGNLALLFRPEDGIYITGGIAPRIRRWMLSEAFLTSYLDKGRMQSVVRQTGVHLVMNESVGLLGALAETANKYQVPGS